MKTCEQFAEDNVQLELGKNASKLLGSIKDRMEHNMEITIMPLTQSETQQQPCLVLVMPFTKTNPRLVAETACYYSEN